MRSHIYANKITFTQIKYTHNHRGGNIDKYKNKTKKIINSSNDFSAINKK